MYLSFSSVINANSLTQTSAFSPEETGMLQPYLDIDGTDVLVKLFLVDLVTRTIWYLLEYSVCLVFYSSEQFLLFISELQLLMEFRASSFISTGTWQSFQNQGSSFLMIIDEIRYVQVDDIGNRYSTA